MPYPGLLHPEPLLLWQATADPIPPQETLKHSKAGLAQSLWDNMAEEKEVSSASPVRTPKLQLTDEQPSTGECWIPGKKDTLQPRAKKKPQQDGRRG